MHQQTSNAAGGHGGEGIQMPGFEYPLIGTDAYEPAYWSNSPFNNHYGGGGSGWGYQLQPDPANYNGSGGGVGNNGAPNAYQVPGINGLGGGGGGNSGDGGSGIVVFRYQYE